MEQRQSRLPSIEERRRSREADAVILQMYGYFNYDDAPRPLKIVTEFDARKAA